MAAFEYWVQLANSTAAHAAQIGGTVAAGGGAGTEGSPFATWAAVATEIERVSPVRSGDTLTVNIHPAACFVNAGTIFDVLTNIGRGDNWASVHLRRWESIVTATPAYASWYPTFHGHQQLSGAWTQGYNNAGTWATGSGDIYRYDTTISCLYASPSYLRVYLGHEIGDNSAGHIIASTFCSTFDDMTTAGDYKLVDNGSTQTIYVKTGVVGSSPLVVWGFASCATFENVGAAAIEWVDPKNVTLTDIQTIGGGMRFYTPAASPLGIDGLSLVRPRHRMNGGQNGISISTRELTGSLPTSAVASSIVIDEPDLNCTEMEARARGTTQSERTAENGILLSGNIDGALITNPKISGFSHGQLWWTPGQVATADRTEYPKNIEVRVTSYANGKSTLTGGPNYQRGLGASVGHSCRIGPLKVRNCNVRNQIAGGIVLAGLDFDASNGDFSDEANNKWYLGAHIDQGIDPFGNVVAHNNVRCYGLKHDVTAAYAYSTDTNYVEDTLTVRGALIRDSGHVRYRGSSSFADSTYTRRKAPLRAEALSFASRGEMFTCTDTMFIKGTGADGFLQVKRANQAHQANATAATHAVLQASESAASGTEAVAGVIDWTSARLARNVEGTIADFGFDADLNYIGERKTPVQTSPRPGRGYR